MSHLDEMGTKSGNSGEFREISWEYALSTKCHCSDIGKHFPYLLQYSSLSTTLDEQQSSTKDSYGHCVGVLKQYADYDNAEEQNLNLSQETE